jgi:hypothetical protein
MMTLELPFPISQAQLRRLHALWREWTGRLHLTPEQNQDLRHYYVALFSQGRAATTKSLTRSDAARVIAWLERLTAAVPPLQRQAAGTAGRHGFPERRRIPPNATAWGALWACVKELGWDRAVLEDFIRTHYADAGLHGLNDLHSMADLNRVLWGVKGILRRREKSRKVHRHAA